MQIKNLLLTLGLAGLLVGSASAQSQKFGVIDLRKVFDGFYRTKQADAKLKEEAADLDKERKAMLDQFQKSQENYKKLLDSANDVAVSTEERDKRKKSAEEELLKLKEQQNNVEQFDRQARTTLGEKQRRMRDNILVEIKDVLRTRAKAGNYTHILDTAAESANNTPVLLYHSGEHDLTDEVLNALNATAPPGALKSDDSKPSETSPAKSDKKDDKK
jgi:outer membrane protein